MGADLRQTVVELRDTSGEPGDLSAPHIGQARRDSARREEGPLTDFQIGMIGGALLGLAVGILTGALMALSRRAEEK